MLVIASEEESEDDILALPDPSLAKNQLEALMTRNKHLMKTKSQLNELEVEINYLSKEKEAKVSALRSKEEQMEQAAKQYQEGNAKLA